MKRLALFALLAVSAAAGIDPHKPAGDVGLDKIVETLVLMESDGRARVKGDGGRAVGILQIWPITVDEANRLAGSDRWTYADRFDPVASRNMCRLILTRRAAWHAKRYGRRATAWELVRSWNSSRTDKKPRPHYWPRFLEINAR